MSRSLSAPVSQPSVPVPPSSDRRDLRVRVLTGLEGVLTTLQARLVRQFAQDINGFALANSFLGAALLVLILADITWNTTVTLKCLWAGIGAVIIGVVLHLVFSRLAALEVQREIDRRRPVSEE